MPSDTALTSLVWNKMTPEQFKAAKKAEMLIDTEFYLVDDGGEAGFIPAPALAEVGQTIRVSKVDENGKPIGWEAGSVDAIWELVGEITVTPENPVVAVSFTGLPNYRYFSVYCANMHMETAGAELGVMINKTLVCPLDKTDDATSAAFLELRDVWFGLYASSTFGNYANRPLSGPNYRQNNISEPATNIDVGNPYYSAKIKSGTIKIYGGR